MEFPPNQICSLDTKAFRVEVYIIILLYRPFSLIIKESAFTVLLLVKKVVSCSGSKSCMCHSTVSYVLLLTGAIISLLKVKVMLAQLSW